MSGKATHHAFRVSGAIFCWAHVTLGTVLISVFGLVPWLIGLMILFSDAAITLTLWVAVDQTNMRAKDLGASLADALRDDGDVRRIH